MVWEDALRLKSGRLGTDTWAAGAVGLISGLIGADDVVADGRDAWFVLGAGEFFRESSERLDISAGGAETADGLGVSTDAGLGSCWGFGLFSSIARLSVILASSISPSSTSSFPEAVLIIFGTPSTLELYISNHLRKDLFIECRLTLGVDSAETREPWGLTS